MNILITGIHGFVGTNLVEVLKSNNTIFGLDIVAPEREGVVKTFSWNEFENLSDIDVVIHLAGKAHDTKNKSDAKTYFDINTGLTEKIFDFFLHSSAKQFIFFSSVKAAADRVDTEYLTEDIIPKPVGPYGESKIKAEEYILSKDWAEKKVYIFRPCMIHGPGNKGNLNLLYNVVIKGIPWPLGAFDNKRSFLNILNLSYIIKQFIDTQPQSGIYHLADDEPISTNELIRMIAKSEEKNAKICNCNERMIKWLAYVGDYCKLPLNSSRLQKLTESYVVSNKKMKTALSIDNLPVDVKDGLRTTLNSFKNK